VAGAGVDQGDFKGIVRPVRLIAQRGIGQCEGEEAVVLAEHSRGSPESVQIIWTRDGTEAFLGRPRAARADAAQRTPLDPDG
jgi:hypothetical protein